MTTPSDATRSDAPDDGPHPDATGRQDGVPAAERPPAQPPGEPGEPAEGRPGAPPTAPASGPTAPSRSDDDASAASLDQPAARLETGPGDGDSSSEPVGRPGRPPAPAGPGWSGTPSASRTTSGPRPQETSAPTTVLPGGRAAPTRPASRQAGRTAAAARPAVRTRRVRLTLKRLDPWSVFVFSLVASVFLGVALVVAVAVLYAVLGSLGVPGSLNQLVAEVTGGNAAAEPLLTSGRIVGGAAVLAAVNVVLGTLLATLGALLYNVCASFTGGLELTFGERD